MFSFHSIYYMFGSKRWSSMFDSKRQSCVGVFGCVDYAFHCFVNAYTCHCFVMLGSKNRWTSFFMLHSLCITLLCFHLHTSSLCHCLHLPSLLCFVVFKKKTTYTLWFCCISCACHHSFIMLGLKRKIGILFCILLHHCAYHHYNIFIP